MKKHFILLSLILVAVSCQKKTNEENQSDFKLLSARQTGIDFKNTLKSTSSLNILNYLYFYNGAGVCVSDFNNDGLVDIFFTGNQVQNELYLNLGDYKFKNISQEAKIPKANWSTGVTSVDINQDGLMDIYICQVTGLKNEQTKNQLLVNQGTDLNGIPVFMDMAEDYGLAISSYAQQAGFFDFDNDGDLDLFLLNHSLYPNRTYGNGNKREAYHPLAGDKLFENRDGEFVELTTDNNIFSSEIGYGLDFSFGDLNMDGHTDIFVGNDFFENDYLYINQQNGSFQELISNNPNSLGHTTHFSMGNAVGDINNDLWPDILSVDMLPQTTKEYKLSGAEYPYLTYQQYLKNNYAPQYMSNTLHLNQRNLFFSEVADYYNLAATDWSWSALIADFNNDAFNDIFIANGILGATNNLDFIKFISNKTYQDKINSGLEKEDLGLLDKLPKYKKQNKLFLNDQNSKFRDVFEAWETHPNSYSNGATYADLNNNGKLDIIVNNINDGVFVYKNESKQNFLKLDFKGDSLNTLGIGSKVILFEGEHKMMRENFVNQGYMSSTAPGVHFGLGPIDKVDSLWVIWPDLNYQVLKNVKANQTVRVSHADARQTFDYSFFESDPVVEQLDSQSIPFKHFEYQSYEFNRQPLIPFTSANAGPSLSIADVNKDGLDDIFFGNAKLKSSQLFIQQDNKSFIAHQEELFEQHKRREDVDQAFFDVDLDGDLDLLVISAGNEFANGSPLQPRLYLNQNGNFSLSDLVFPTLNEQFNSIAIADINQDGYPDIFFGAGVEYTTFGKSPKSYLFLNNQDYTFTDVTLDYFSTHELGMIRDAHFKDINQDGLNELIVAGYFMPVEIYRLESRAFEKINVDVFQETNGLWNTIHFVDLNNDGFEDLLVGNLGTNTKLKASKQYPINIYLNDFNENGQLESIMTYHHNGKEVLFNTKDELASQIPAINKKFRSYQAFSEAKIENVLGDRKIASAEKKRIHTLHTMFFLNKGEFEFEAKALPKEVQYSSIQTATSFDMDNDGKEELILAGNRFDLNTQLGQLDANHGLVLTYQNNRFSVLKNANLNLEGRVNSAEVIDLKDEKWLIFGTNNDSLQIFRSLKK